MLAQSLPQLDNFLDLAALLFRLAEPCPQPCLQAAAFPDVALSITKMRHLASPVVLRLLLPLHLVVLAAAAVVVSSSGTFA